MESKIYILYIKGPKSQPEGKFLAELLGQADSPGFFRIKLRAEPKEELIVNRNNLELDWIKQ